MDMARRGYTSVRATPAAMVVGLSSGLYTTRVPPAAAPHAGHQAAFVFGVIFAVLFILGLFD